jgi:mannose-6-phosphate isomerase class I
MLSNFNKFPSVRIQAGKNDFFSGWKEISGELRRSLDSVRKDKKVLVLETYQGVYHDEILSEVSAGLDFDTLLDAREVFLPEKEINRLVYPDLTDDRIFGYLSRLNMIDFMDRDKLEEWKKKLRKIDRGTVLVYGYGAALLEPEPDILVYADMARWEIQLRMRKDQVSNLGVENREETIEQQYKRGYFVDWRVCDRLKKKLMGRWDYVLDTNRKAHPKMARGEVINSALEHTCTRPFSVVPYFDPGPWGGQWMKEVIDLDRDTENFAWCFNCIPEENSLYLQFGDEVFEMPSINLVFSHPARLLGDAVYARFGDEFPIRFDFLDTMDGGNLSLQVHPLTEYIQQTFGLHYTQDESYYLVDAGEGASVYLGLREGVDPEGMIHELLEAERTGGHFDADKHVMNWPAKKHDHFLIPAGTVHCSGKNGMVLEISSTPYIFTFKLWDWGRLGIDGKPRPINIGHGINVIQWDRTESWTKKNLINRIEEMGRGDGWVEEKTGLHEREFIETRRHWFTKKVLHNTHGGVNVLNLVEGREAVVESPTRAFEPFVVHYAETFIVPACVGEYTISPHGESKGMKCATIKAFVRT